MTLIAGVAEVDYAFAMWSTCDVSLGSVQHSGPECDPSELKDFESKYESSKFAPKFVPN